MINYKLNNKENLITLKLIEFFEKIFNDMQSQNKVLHAIMFGKTSSKIIINSIKTTVKLGNDKEKYKNTLNAGKDFLNSISMIFDLTEYKLLMNLLNENNNLDTTRLDEYFEQLVNSKEYTKLSFLFAILSHAELTNTENSIIDLSYSDYLLPSLNKGKILNLKNTRLNLNKLCSLNYNDLEILLENIYNQATVFVDENNHSESAREFLEKGKNEIIYEKQIENENEMTKYKELLHENHFEPIYSMEFPDNYKVIIYYNNRINSFIEDVECNGISMVMISTGKNAIKYYKKGIWKAESLYFCSFEDLILNLENIVNYLSTVNREEQNVELINLCEEYINKASSLHSNSDRHDYIENLIRDLNNFDSIREKDISILLDEITFTGNILSDYYDSGLEEELSLTEFIIQKDILNNKIIDFSLDNETYPLPFGYYASYLDKIYGCDFVEYKEISNCFHGYEEGKDSITIMYNAIRFINNVLEESDTAQGIEILNNYHDKTISLMEPIAGKRGYEKVIQFNRPSSVKKEKKSPYETE